MLRLDDRLRLAMTHGMSAQLTPEEAKQVAGWLVTLRSISRGRSGRAAGRAAAAALGDMKPER